MTAEPAVPGEDGPFSANEPPGSDVLPPLEQREGENAKQERLAQEQAQEQQDQDQNQNQDQQQQSSEENERDTEGGGS